MARSGQQMLMRRPAMAAATEPNLVTMESSLLFSHGGGPLVVEDYRWNMLGLLVRLSDDPEPPGSWAALPQQLRFGCLTGHHLGLSCVPGKLVELLADRKDDFSTAIIALEVDAIQGAMLADIVGALRSAPGEIHLVAERALIARERALKAASVVLAPSGRTLDVAAQMFTAISSAAAEMQLACLDWEDSRQAYGTADRPSRMVEAWWDEARCELAFSRPEERSIVRTAKVAVVTIYGRRLSHSRGAMNAIRRIVDDDDPCIFLAAPFDCLEPDPVRDPALVRLHVLCAPEFPGEEPS